MKTVTKKKPKIEATTLLLSDFEPIECGTKLTPRQVVAIINMTHRRALLMRSSAHWSPEEEAAYFNGAMCAFFATRNNGDIPGHWVFGAKDQDGVLGMLKRWKVDGKKINAPRVSSTEKTKKGAARSSRKKRVRGKAV
jgi:hypothetical protein